MHRMAVIEMHMFNSILEIAHNNRIRDGKIKS